MLYMYIRTKNTLSKLKSDSLKLEAYIETMYSNIDHSFVEPIPESDLKVTNEPLWYLPIFPVSHPKKSKIRLYSL